MGALAEGRLIPDTQTGLALAAPDGMVHKVMWPYGYSARYVDDRIELIDPSGNFVAAEGDRVQMGGGFGPTDLFYACSGSVERVGG